MSSATTSSRVRRRDHDEEGQPERTYQPQAANQTAVAGGAVSQQTSAADAEGAQPQPQFAGVQPLPEQFGQRKKPRRSSYSACHLNKLAVVEMQLILQCLDTKSKLTAARCCRRLLQAADHPFAWQGPFVAVSADDQPQPGSLIRQSLLRHAPIALTLDADSEVSAAEVAAIPRLREMVIEAGSPSRLILQVLALPALQGLQTLLMCRRLPLSTLRLLATLPALHTLYCGVWHDPEDWSWLPAMRALTHLDIVNIYSQSLPQPALDAIGQCAQLRSLRLQCPRFTAGCFMRLCSTPSMRRLRHLRLDGAAVDNLAAEEFTADAFGALASLESLRLHHGIGVDRLPHLDQAPALRMVVIGCTPDKPNLRREYGPSHPSRTVLRRLLTAAPRLEVRLQMAATIGEWRTCWLYHESSAADREQMDEQWLELQRMGAELERVTIVDEYSNTFSFQFHDETENYN